MSDHPLVSQSVAEAGTSTSIFAWSVERIKQMIAALGSGMLPTYIIIPPTDWMHNDDVDDKGNSLDDGANVGVHVGDASNEMYVGVAIPEGTKATLVDITASAVKTIEAFSVTTAGVKTSLGTGSSGTQLNITDIPASDSTYLLLKYAATATTNDVRFTKVTLAAV